MMHSSVYRKGIHQIVDLEKCPASSLSDLHGLRELWNTLIQQFDLHMVGEVYHPFDSGGFTAVVCLTESHFSVHTWPEFGRVTFDIFLSNFQRSNDGTVETIVRRTQHFFGGELVQTQQLNR